MIDGVFKWFESRLNPYPLGEPQQPPKGLVAFCLHYCQGAKRWLIAMAVLGATIVMFFLTQGMMRSATGLGWADVMTPQVPALTGAAALVAVLWGLDAIIPDATIPAVVLVAQVCATGLFALAFAWWCPFRDARLLMHEVVSDLSPRLATLVWSDVAVTKKARRARQRASEPEPRDAGTQAAP